MGLPEGGAVVAEPPRPVTLRGALVVDADRGEERDLHIAGGRIVEAAAPGARVLDLSGFAVFAGLVNAHDHLPLNAVPPPPRTRTFPNAYEWIDAFQPHFEDPEVKRALAIPEATRAAHGGLKNLLSGTTTVAHHDPWLDVFDDPAFPVRVVPDLGFCHSLGLAGRYGPSVADAIRATRDGRPFVLHLAEGRDAIAAGELDRLDALGALGPRTVLVHAVGLTASGVSRVLDAGAAVVWCPASNLAILGKTLDPRPFAARGRLALGTDSRLSGSRDLLAELRVAREASDLTPKELVRLVTKDAAAVLGERDAGTLTPGARADLVLLRRPSGDPWTALVETERAELAAVVRAGQPAIADPSFAGWFEEAGGSFRWATLDGREKLAASSLGAGAAVLEPGFALIRSSG